LNWSGFIDEAMDSNSGGTDKGLTISNTNTGASSAVKWMASASVSDGQPITLLRTASFSGNAKPLH
jgi:hypothetical protein